MYAPQAMALPNHGTNLPQEKAPNVVIREINNSHADFILENCDLRYVVLMSSATDR